MAIKSANQSGLGGNEVTLLKSQGVIATGGSVICLNGHMLHKFTGTSTFNALQPLNVEFLIVGGGGSAGSALYHSGGGGGGGFVQGSMYIPAGTYTVTVGAGGANPGSNTLKGNNGNNSSFNGIVAYGGGGAGVYACVTGRDGANGGGGGAQAGVVGLGGLGCLGQGYIGGCYNGNDSGNKTGGGGAGAFGNGGVGNGSGTNGGGGNGMPSFISNTLIYYGGGGGGSTECVSIKTTGGWGGGGQGNYNFGQDGTANSGGGGGAGERVSPAIGGSGGSGIVYIKYKTNNSTGPIGQIVTNCLVYYADADNIVSYPGLVNIVGAKISSTFGNVSGAWRASCYSVQYSSDNSTWNTAFTGIMSNNGNFGIQSGTSSLTTPVGPYRYWRYVEGTSICNHHPRVSRIMLTDANGNDYVICKYTNDNVSDVGEYQIGTITRDFCSIWHDMSGCSNTANLINTPAYSRSNGGIFYFNGSNYVPSHCYNQPTTAMSLDVWVTANNINQKQTILSKWGASGLGRFSWLFFTNWFGDPGNIFFLTSPNGSGYNSVAMAHCLQPGKWINYAVTFDAGNVKMYRNGQLASAETVGTTSLLNPVTPFTVGADWDQSSSDGLTRTWEGCIGSVRVYGSVLSHNDILQNFNASRGRFCV